MLGQVGKVLKVYADGDLRVAFGGQTWTFNPACLSAQPVEVDANLMTAENPNESGSKASAGTRGLVSNTTAQALSPAGFQLWPCFPHFSFATHAFSSRLHLWHRAVFFCFKSSVCLFLAIFSVACPYPACSQPATLAAQDTFVIMSEVLSSFLIKTKSAVCVWFRVWEADNRLVYVCECVQSDSSSCWDILTHSTLH